MLLANLQTDLDFFTDVPLAVVTFGRSLNPKNILEGADVYFECHVKSNPPFYNITWRNNVRQFSQALKLAFNSLLVILKHRCKYEFAKVRMQKFIFSKFVVSKLPLGRQLESWSFGLLLKLSSFGQRKEPPLLARILSEILHL